MKIQTTLNNSEEDMQVRSVGDMELSILKNSPVAFYSCNSKGEITYYNKAAVRLWGRKPTIGEDLWCGAWKVYHPDGTPMPLEDHPAKKMIEEGQFDQNSKIRIQRPDHSFKNILLIAQPHYLTDKKIGGAHFTLIDFSEFLTDHYKQATLSAIVESSDDAIISKDLNGKITSWNAGAQRIFGYTENEVLGRHITMLFPASRLMEEENIIAKLKQGERIEHFETTRIGKTGKMIPLSMTISPLKDAHGNIIGASKVARDISDRVENFEKQAILSAIVESSDDAIISKNLDGIIMSWNRGAQEIFGYSEEEAVGNSITMLIPKEKLQEETKILAKIRRGEKVDHFQTIRRHKSGRRISLSITVSPVRDHKGTIIGASKVARDITLQVRSQQALKKYSTNLEILNNIGKFISENLNVKEILQKVINVTTQLTESNFGIFYYNFENQKHSDQSYFTAAGISKQVIEKLKKLKSPNLFSETTRKKQILYIEDIENETVELPPFYQRLKDDVNMKSFMAVPVYAKSGLVIGGMVYGHSEKNHFTSEHELLVANIAAQAATALQNSQLFEQVKSLSEKKDEFIALASHELKTPLTTVKGYLQLLSKMNQEEKTSLFLNKTLHQVERLNMLIEDLLNMSRIEKGKLEFNIRTFDIKEMLEELLHTFEYSNPGYIIEHTLGNKAVMMSGDPQRIEQVIINLLTNAIKYSPHGDKIEVYLTYSDANVTVKIKDYGIGLTPKDQENLFERFYRAEGSKGISGLGIGLYLSKQIIHRHGGEIGVESEYGKGSEFYFVLPRKNK